MVVSKDNNIVITIIDLIQKKKYFLIKYGISIFELVDYDFDKGLENTPPSIDMEMTFINIHNEHHKVVIPMGVLKEHYDEGSVKILVALTI